MVSGKQYETEVEDSKQILIDSGLIKRFPSFLIIY